MAGLPILALLGLTSDEGLWHHQAAALGAVHPLVSFALTPHVSMVELAALALARAPAGRFVLVGLSMGGCCAFEIMRQAPDRVAALALLDTSARPDSPEQTAARGQAIAASATNYAAAIDAFLPRLVHPSRQHDPSVMRPLPHGDASRARGLCAPARGDHRPRGQPADACRIRCPTLVLCGRENALTPLPLAEEMHAGIAGSRLVVVEHCGHESSLERPAAVIDALRDLLADAN